MQVVRSGRHAGVSGRSSCQYLVWDWIWGLRERAGVREGFHFVGLIPTAGLESVFAEMEKVFRIARGVWGYV